MMEKRKSAATPAPLAPVDMKSKETEISLNNYIKLYNEVKLKLSESIK